VAAYGQILPKSLLELPRHGCVNVHASLLPKYRGAAPIQWSILNGDAETGVTIMKMDEGLDTGGMLSRAATPIDPADTAQTLHDRLAALGADLLLPTLQDYIEGKAPIQPQPEGASYARKIVKDDGRIDWRQPANALWLQVRAMNPWPTAHTWIPASPKPALLKIWEAAVEKASGAPGTVLKAEKDDLIVACGCDALRILSLQREGKRRMTAREFLAGQPIIQGTLLSGSDSP
jgi:methionyl-tRNA formyltransferase